jgi:hypothetical protein
LRWVGLVFSLINGSSAILLAIIDHHSDGFKYYSGSATFLLMPVSFNAFQIDYQLINRAR